MHDTFELIQNVLITPCRKRVKSTNGGYLDDLDLGFVSFNFYQDVICTVAKIHSNFIRSTFSIIIPY